MPELPEVQTFINQLQTKILNKQIINVEFFMEKILKNTSIEELKRVLIDQEFTKLERIGKYIIFHLTNDYVVVLHLRMEGKPFYHHKNDFSNFQHVLFRIIFNNEHELRYHDTRRFGTVHLFHKNNYLNAKELVKLGLDPTNKNFSVDYVESQLSKSPNSKIKTSLLDQTKISGIGNIYADEILYASKIFPTTLIKNLTKKDFFNITYNSKKIIAEAIKEQGTTIVSYKYKDGSTGNFQNKLQVHMRAKKKCNFCDTIIEKMKVNGRGTYYCQKCQNNK